jgi:PST family polysaccharide transporter
LFPVWLFQGLQKMQHIAARDFIAKLTAVGALFLFVHSDRDYLLAVAVQSGGMVLAGLAGLLTVPFVTTIRLRFPPWSEVVDALKNGWPVFLSMAAMTLAGGTNTFIMGFRAPLSEVAYFSNAQRVIVAMRMLVSPLVTALYPHMSQKAAYDKGDAVRFLRKYSFAISAPFLLLSLVVLVSAPMAVRIVFGAKYAPTVLPLQIMAFSPFLLALSHCYSTNFMLAFGYEKQWSRIIFASVIVNFAFLIPLLYLLRPSVGVAVTWIAVDVITTSWYYIFYRRHSAQYLDTMASSLKAPASDA